MSSRIRAVAGGRLWFLPLAGLALFALTAAGRPAHPAPNPTPRAAHFSVFDNTFYRDVDLEQYGAVKSNVVYESPVAALSGQDPARFRGERPASAELALPPKAAFQDLVRRTSRNPGPVVLDFETLYLRGTPAVAERRFRKLQTLLDWSREAVPGRTLGYYGVLGNTEPRYLGLERRLAAGQDALFPSLYTFSTDRNAWLRHVRYVMGEAAAIAPNKPVYVYLWPQFHGGTKQAGRYLTPDQWEFELDTAAQVSSGAVIWGPNTGDPDQAWVAATAGFLSTGV